MARGTTLGELVEMLRLEVGQSSNPALGQNVRPALVHRLKKKQEELYDKYDWPFLRVRRDKIIAAGQRYRSEEHTSELRPLTRNPYAVFWFKNKKLQTYFHYIRL